MGVTVTPSFAQLRNKPSTVAGFGITDMATQTVANATNATAVPFSGVTGKPTTLTGYGITDEKCRAWVNFNGGSIAIRGSHNVSSITDNGVGDYTVNYSTPMPNANYAAIVVCNKQSGVDNAYAGPRSGGLYTWGVRVEVNNWASPFNLQDAGEMQIIIFQ